MMNLKKKWAAGALATMMVASSFSGAMSFADTATETSTETKPPIERQERGAKMAELIAEYYPEAQSQWEELDEEMKATQEQIHEIIQAKIEAGEIDAPQRDEMGGRGGKQGPGGQQPDGDRPEGGRAGGFGPNGDDKDGDRPEPGNKPGGRKGHRGPGMGEDKRGGIENVIELTEAQQAALEDFQAEKQAEREAQREAGERPEKPSEDDREDRQQELYEALDLTDDQIAQLEAHQAERQAEREANQEAREAFKTAIEEGDAEAIKEHIDDKLEKMAERLDDMKEKLAELQAE